MKICIVALADVFDALATPRDGRGGHFGSICVDAFLAELDAVLAIRDESQDEREDA